MKIFITAHSARFGGGISVAKNIIAGLARVAPGHHYITTVPANHHYENVIGDFKNIAHAVFHHKNILQRWLWDEVELPKLVRIHAPDVIFNIGNKSMLRNLSPQATLLQDAHLFYPRAHFGPISYRRALLISYNRMYLRRSIPYTQLFFCQTETAAKRFRATYRYGSRIAICPNAPSALGEDQGPAEASPARLQHTRKFSLFVPSKYYPHKNLMALVAAYLLAQEKLSDVITFITIARGESSEADRFLETIAKHRLEKNIIPIGTLGHGELANYYRNTDAVLLPTLLESFSGVYLEAIKYKKPIITSDMDFARNICGRGALYFDPLSPQSIVDAIWTLVNSSDARASLIAEQASLQSPLQDWDSICLSVLMELEKIRVSRKKA